MAQVVVTMSPDEQKLFRAQEKLIQQQAKMRAGYSKVAKSAKQAGGTAKKSATVQQRAGRAITGQLTGMVGGYLSVMAAARLFNQVLEDQNALAREAVQAQKSLAAAQQDAIKNLTGLSSQQKSNFLKKDVLEIQRSTGFPDQALLASAGGAGVSASGDLRATKNAVKTAAQVTILTPGAVVPTAAGLLDIANSTGIKDAERNLGFALTAGSINRIEDPVKLSENLAPVVKAAVNSAPGQDRIEAAREGGAIFGVAARSIVDKQGTSTNTNVTKLLNKMERFFTDRKEGDPGTIFGRFEAMQRNPSLRADFLGDEGIGEERFKKTFQLMLTAGSDLAKELKDSKEKISFDARVAKQTIREISTATPQIRLGILANKHAASIQQLDLNPQIGRKGLARQILQETLKKTRTGSLFEPNQEKQLLFHFDRSDPNVGPDPETRARNSLLVRRKRLFGKGSLSRDPIGARDPTSEELAKLTPEKREKVLAIGRAIQLLRQSREGALDDKVADALERAAESQRSAAAAMERAANKLEEKAVRSPQSRLLIPGSSARQEQAAALAE